MDCMHFPGLERITLDPHVMGGKPCIRNLRVTVSMLLGLIASGVPLDSILEMYPYLQKEDIEAALTFAKWRTDDYELELPVA